MQILLLYLANRDILKISLIIELYQDSIKLVPILISSSRYRFYIL